MRRKEIPPDAWFLGDTDIPNSRYPVGRPMSNEEANAACEEIERVCARIVFSMGKRIQRNSKIEFEFLSVCRNVFAFVFFFLNFRIFLHTSDEELDFLI